MAKTNLLDRILDDNEKIAIKQFYDSEVMREAVRKVLLSSVYYNGILLPGEEADPTRNFMLTITNRREMSNEEMGAQARAVAEGLAALENGFSALAAFKTEDVEKAEEKNPAR